MLADEMEIENKRGRGEKVPGALRTAARICRGGAIPAASRRFMHQAPGPCLRVEKQRRQLFLASATKREECEKKGPCAEAGTEDLVVALCATSMRSLAQPRPALCSA